MALRFITTAAGLNVIVDGENRVVPKDHKSYEQILAGLKAGDFSVVNLLDEFKKAVEDFDGVDFQIVAGELLYRGQPYENKFITEQVMKMIEKGVRPAPLIRFLEKVEQNPVKQSVNDLWKFMEKTGLALSDDGDILAFKYVTEVTPSNYPELYAKGVKYTDSHTRTWDYTPGHDVPEMPRHKIHYDPGTACGTGLHVGDLSYVAGQQTILAVKVNPADVGSVAGDDSRKVRVCRFTPLHIVNPEHLDEEGYKEPVFSVKDGKMARSEFYRESYKAYGTAGKAPEGFADHESASHW